MATTSAAQVTSPGRRSLLGLPAELRNRIYELVLIQPEPILLGNTEIPKDAPKRTRDAKVQARRAILPPLLRTNHQIRSETCALFFSANSFITSSSSRGYSRRETIDWLKVLGPNARLIRKISGWFSFSAATDTGHNTGANAPFDLKILNSVPGCVFKCPEKDTTNDPDSFFRRLDRALQAKAQQLRELIEGKVAEDGYGGLSSDFYAWFMAVASRNGPE